MWYCIGGGSGYEFVYVGYVGEGMFIVVICGDMFVVFFVNLILVVSF